MRRLDVLALALAAALAIAACGQRALSPSAAPEPGPRGRLSLSALLGVTADDGYERALAPRPFVFPDDDGPHAGFRSEWWYFTGVLHTPDGAGARRFGYEMTIFRQALAPRATPRASAWATRDVYMGHFAITDVDGARGGGSDATGDPRFHAHERFARDGLALAGARAQPFAVWVDDWRMDGPAIGGPLPVHLSARDDDGAAIELVVGAEGAGIGQPIAEGDRGLSVKGPAPGNASYYYSRASLATRGRVTLPAAGAASPGLAVSFTVLGQSWMDREWSTGALGAGVRGWDWLGVHLSDGRDLMMYRLRDADEKATAASRITVIAPPSAARERGVRSYAADRFALTPIDVWTSAQSGARYPVSFGLDVPDEKIHLVVRPLLVDQELRLAVLYWEGAVSLSGTADGAAISGEGYLELTGYGGGQRQR